MKKKLLAALLALALLSGALAGCGDPAPADPTVSPTTVTTAPPATVPADGDPEDVTRKGSYTGTGAETAVVARAGEAELTNAQLAAWYWALAAAYRQGGYDVAPDFDQPLDTQACPLDESVRTWQQYFLRQALTAWHTAQGLALQAQTQGLPKEEAYIPIDYQRDDYLGGQPATRYLYRYTDYYQPNTMHQEYLDTLPDTLDQLAQDAGFADADELAQAACGTDAAALEQFAQEYNFGYMYFVSLADYIEITQEEVEDYYSQNSAAYARAGVTSDAGHYVDLRTILLVPQEEDAEEGAAVEVAADGTVTCPEDLWEACKLRAEELLEQWSDGKATDASFGELANKHSADANAALNGGAYRQVAQGQLMEALDSWCFQPDRQSGDTAIIRGDYGYLVVYLTAQTDIWYAQAEADLTRQRQQELLDDARSACALEVDYSAIVLPEGSGAVSAGDLLYPDIAHERFPEVPLYLQQDYKGTMFGGFQLATNGCGITSLAMIASYLTDTELTPPEMCARYGRYSHANGTDGMIFTNEPQVLGFYLVEKTYDPPTALAALKEGHVVVSIQHPGYWTRGGHYIVLEKVNDDGTIQVRDSNYYNYQRISSHINDSHTWGSITSAGSGYWIFDYKVTRISACARCGDGESPDLFARDYTCEKCRPALLRRQTYLTYGG